VIVYLDTSALVKLLVTEAGSPSVSDLWDRAQRLFTSRMAYPEARAALASVFRSGSLAGAGFRSAKHELERRWSEMVIVEVTAELAAVAGEVAEDFDLRGYDATHLASALAIADAEPVVATWDLSLAGAAHRAGLVVTPALEPAP